MELTFTVYDNRTNTAILRNAEWCEVEDYVENQSLYTVVCNLNGQIMQGV